MCAIFPFIFIAYNNNSNDAGIFCINIHIHMCVSEAEKK